jgi:hypothetical protein
VLYSFVRNLDLVGVSPSFLGRTFVSFDLFVGEHGIESAGLFSSVKKMPHVKRKSYREKILFNRA